ncbi:MAG: alpha-glucosidase [Silicimonas sp.]|nr:alpha-glucosidase [Silicimonas sp.]
MTKNEWWRHAVIYQVYPRSFQDDNGDGVGDLAGITRRLDHIASLGVDVVWLSPVFTSPQKDMGYDISDQCDIDPLFGSLDDFDDLLARTHELGLKLIVDQVPSHTSDQHPWFVASRASRDNPKSDWYVWADAKPDGSPPNNWLSVFGGPAWTWDPRRRQYYLHSFLASQPQMNFHNPEVVEATLETMRFWLDRGVDGFRLDSINYPFHDEQLRDNPPKDDATPDDWVNPYNVQRHIYDKSRPETLEFLEQVRAMLDRYSGTMTVGEVGEGSGAARIMGDYTRGDGRLHMAYSFEMLGPQYTPAYFRSCVGGFFDEAQGGWPCWAFSNHDVVRHVSRWSGRGDTDAVARQAIALLLSFEGAKCLYQGEELGQTETVLTYDEIVDPPGLKFWPEYKGRDGCRTPMVWEADAPGAGFTLGDPWLPIKAPQAARAVDRQETDPASILHHYRALLSFYRDCGPLRATGTDWIDLPDPLLAFRRGGAGGLTAVFNLGATPLRLALSGDTEITGPAIATHAGTHLDLPGHGFAWLTRDPGLALTP